MGSYLVAMGQFQDGGQHLCWAQVDDTLAVAMTEEVKLKSDKLSHFHTTHCLAHTRVL